MQIQVLNEEGDVVEVIEFNDYQALTTRVGQDELGHRVTAAALRAVAATLNDLPVDNVPDDGLYTVRNVAKMCNVQVQTVHRWRLRDRPTTSTMPREIKRIADRPLWDPLQITTWAKATDRYKRDPRTGEWAEGVDAEEIAEAEAEEAAKT